MRILLAAKHHPEGRRPIGGVQTWCRTVKQELVARGHEVETWGPEVPVPLGGFDLGIVANVGDAHRAMEICTKNIVVSHGIIPAEKPPTHGTVVFTSEEVRDHWGGTGEIVRQPIDLEFWAPKEAPRVFLTRFSYRRGLIWLPSLANSLGLRFQHIRNVGPERVREGLHKSACVLATGRAALEAMACDVPVVIVDHRSAYQQPLLHDDITWAMKRNYSGRGGVVPTMENVMQAVNRAVDRGGMRDHVKEHHDVSNIVDQLLELP
jgi:hypothetical protein